MSLQRQSFGHSRPAAPKRIPFFVSGRTTLSEHLPAEIIDVPIAVAQRSSYLRKAIKRQALEDLTEGPIRLPGIDPTGFRIYIDWLKTGRVEFHTPTSTSTGNGLLLRDSFDLIFAHIAGSQLEEADFQDYIIDELSRLLDGSQTPDLKVLEVVFLEKGASNILKQFVIDRMFAVEGKMLSMMRGFVGIGSTETAQGCEYHVHEAGECYRNTVTAEQIYTESFANNSYDGFNSRESSVYDGNKRFQPPTPTLQCRAKPAYTAFYDMAETSYFGSAEWSREVHGLSRHTPMHNLRTDKPLPVIPPLTPGTSPIPPYSLQSLQSSLLNGEDAYPSTQQLISECLARLPHSPAPSSQPSDPHGSVIPVLILECLERFKRNNAERSCSPESEAPPPQQSHAGPSSPVRSPTRRALRSGSPSKKQVRWQPSFDEIPKLDLSYFGASSPAQKNIPSYRSYSARAHPRAQRPDSSPPVSYRPSASRPPYPSSPSPTLCQSIPRKPAPHRGSDWLTQYNLINTLSSTPKPSLIAAKKSKKSRFVEMLRSDSLMGRIAMVMDLEREGSTVRVRSAMN